MRTRISAILAALLIATVAILTPNPAEAAGSCSLLYPGQPGRFLGCIEGQLRTAHDRISDLEANDELKTQQIRWLIEFVCRSQGDNGVYTVNACITGFNAGFGVPVDESRSNASLADSLTALAEADVVMGQRLHEVETVTDHIDNSLTALADGFCGMTGPYAQSCFYDIIGGQSPALPDGWQIAVPEIQIETIYEHASAYPFLVPLWDEDEGIIVQQGIDTTLPVVIDTTLEINALTTDGWDDLTFHFEIEIDNVLWARSPSVTVNAGSFRLQQVSLDIPHFVAQPGRTTLVNVNMVVQNEGMVDIVRPEFVLRWRGMDVRDGMTNDVVPDARIATRVVRTGQFMVVPVSIP